MSNVLRGTLVNPDKVYGKSAYEIAVMHGFDGTEKEWLESLGQYEESAITQATKAKQYAERAEKAAEDLEAGLTSGNIVAAKATNADNATNADKAKNADKATNADKAAKADSATTATTATNAERATSAGAVYTKKFVFDTGENTLTHIEEMKTILLYDISAWEKESWVDDGWYDEDTGEWVEDGYYNTTNIPSHATYFMINSDVRGLGIFRLYAEDSVDGGEDAITITQIGGDHTKFNNAFFGHAGTSDGVVLYYEPTLAYYDDASDTGWQYETVEITILSPTSWHSFSDIQCVDYTRTKNQSDKDNGDASILGGVFYNKWEADGVLPLHDLTTTQGNALKVLGINLNGLTTAQAKNLKTFAVGETKTFEPYSLETENYDDDGEYIGSTFTYEDVNVSLADNAGYVISFCEGESLGASTHTGFLWTNFNEGANTFTIGNYQIAYGTDTHIMTFSNIPYVIYDGPAIVKIRRIF